MARQKQVDECLSRCIAGQPPLEHHKLTASLVQGQLTLNHYHHKILVYDMCAKKALHQWWEKPTDKRILDAALAYLDQAGQQRARSEGHGQPGGARGQPSTSSSSRQARPATPGRPAPPAPPPRAPTETLGLGHLGSCRVAH
eukprot:CAMPEP_0179299932 /NCGR_PEP_ID=MMETSP0797-20121207/46770_1 /TAXON_ID=47934 /ORGANISM="Dinophysis acuminata, Strain DAEP01" /LENGTH=141 /DNA_ID=CAMNT_0021009379 /DNA_START=28 /DNA_END=450 /DNA_ORIENTATION=+